MEHETRRTILLGLALNPTDADRRAAVEAVMSEEETVSDHRDLTIPVLDGRCAQLRLPYPLTSGDWAQLLGVLEAMRPAFLREPNLAENGQGVPRPTLDPSDLDD